MSGISKRIFGSEIPKNVRQKLELRQKLSRSPDPGESMDLTETSEIYRSNFNGEADLSSRTSFARMWVGLSLRYTAEEVNKDGKVAITTENVGGEIYVVGNHVYNNANIKPNQQRQEYPTKVENNDTSIKKSVMPKELESNNNEFLQPPAGIKSITSQTEGIGVTKRTTVNFKVYNFHDFENIYHKYFLRPGALIFLDFGWDIASLYDPEECLEKGWEDLDTYLYGEEGKVTLSAGDLEVIIGQVVNFNSKVGEDGSVDCSLELVSSNASLMSHNLQKSSAQKLREKLIFGLNYQVVQFILQAPVFSDYKKLFTQAEVRSYESLEAWSAASDAFAMRMLASDEDFQFPDATSRLLGVFWAKHTNSAGGVEVGRVNGKNLYVSWGVFEDLILNREFGNGASTFDDVLTGKNSIRFDSSNSYVRWDKNLIERQKYALDKTTLVYICPDRWGNTYSTNMNKTPVYPKDVEEYNEQLAAVNKELKTEYTIEQQPLTNDQIRESIIQYEYHSRNMGLDYQTVDPDRQPYKPDEPGYIPEVHGFSFKFFCYKSREGFIAGNTYTGGPDGYLEVEREISEFSDWALDQTLGRMPLRELFVNVSTIKKAFLDEEKVSDVVKSILDAISYDSQNIFDLQVSSNDYGGKEVAIIDRNFVNTLNNAQPIEGIFKFEVNSPHTITKAFDIEYTIPSDEYGSMLAIQALSGTSPIFPLDEIIDSNLALHLVNEGHRANDYRVAYMPTVGGEYKGNRLVDTEIIDTKAGGGEARLIPNDTFGFDKDKRNTLDSFFATINNDLSENFDDNSAWMYTSDQVKKATNLGQDWGGNKQGWFDWIFSGIAGSDEPVKDQVNIQNLKKTNQYQAHSSQEYFELKAKSEFFKSQKSNLLPINVTLTIYGISSLMVGDIFRINYLPSRYGENAFYQCMGITHNVDSNGWTTQLITKMRLKTDTIIMSKEDSGLYYFPDFGVSLGASGFRSNYPLLKIIHKHLEYMDDLRPIAINDNLSLKDSVFNQQHFFIWQGSDGTSLTTEYRHPLSTPLEQYVGKGDFDSNVLFGQTEKKESTFDKERQQGWQSDRSPAWDDGGYYHEIRTLMQPGREYLLFHNGINWVIVPTDRSDKDWNLIKTLFQIAK